MAVQPSVGNQGQAVARLYIGGEWRESPERALTRDPFHKTPVTELHVASGADVEDAVRAAVAAKPVMAGMPAHKRAQILRRAAEELMRRRGEVARSITAENGKPAALAQREVGRAAETLEFAADEAKRLAGEVIPMDSSSRGENKLGFTLRVPVGIVGAITPFNSPLNLMAHKVGPALAGGNTVVLKPAPQTPWCSVYLVEALEAAGLPPGAINVVHGGPDVGEAIVTHPGVNLVTFTGGIRAGARIRNIAGMKKVLLELGGNAGNIVCADANLDRAAREMAANAFGYSGQSCIAVQRIYVERPVYEAFLEKLLQYTSRLRVGDPWLPETDIGPMISEEAAERVEAWIKEAEQQGARILCGGKRDGALLEPTVLVDVRPEMKVVCEEVFGPVVSVVAVDSLEEAIAAVNDSQYGLQAGIFTASLGKALQAVRSLEVGGVVVNGTSNFRLEQMPYGGVKLSGIGKEGPRYAVEEMTVERMVIIDLAP
ncbi:aldehyde dehydrogenase family protein [Geochorda subterranea]|uniref:Aldehyde dehydrogenase family protein n=1 Tax=Geochorda subterranea TaxID=3109564 RepID=A0ABZ1BR13_9FIRM|nr:aldehyde dehydrogenase family protein [Limnochorda sp. LNt]WRP15250.1 aldehyde dehydrogenase family protein [Limnochorda sp. LNt]